MAKDSAVDSATTQRKKRKRKASESSASVGSVSEEVPARKNPGAAGHDGEMKAAVMSALLQGQSIQAVAKTYKVSRKWVGKMKRRLDDEVYGEEINDDERKAVGELLIEYLRASIASLVMQTQVFGDQTWLEQQDASSLAVLHGVQTDKVVRLLEAMGAPDESEEAD